MPSLAAAFLLAAIAPLQDPTPIAVQTKEGKTVQVQVLGLENGKAKVKVFFMGGEVTMTRDLADLTPETAYLVEVRATDPKTFEQHLALAKRAAELDLLPAAGAQARKALKLAGEGPAGEAKKKELAAWAADALEKMIQDSVAAGDLERAEHCLEILTTRLPETRTEEQLATIADGVDMLRQQDSTKKAADRAAKLESKRAADIAKALEPIAAKRASGDKKLSKAVSQSKTAESARQCDAAVEDYKAAFKLAQELVKSKPDDADLQSQLAPITDEIVASALRAALHAANVLTLQSDYKSATDWVNRILKFDPENEDAKEMLKTIQQAQASAGDRDDYRWGWRGRGRARR